jgi:hypothetical protein
LPIEVRVVVGEESVGAGAALDRRLEHVLGERSGADRAAAGRLAGVAVRWRRVQLLTHRLSGESARRDREGAGSTHDDRELPEG